MMLWSNGDDQAAQGVNIMQECSTSQAALATCSISTSCAADKMSLLPKAAWTSAAAAATDNLYDHTSLMECTRCAQQGNYTSTLYGGGGTSSSSNVMMVDGGVSLMGEYDHEQEMMVGMENWGGGTMKLMKKRKLTSEQAQQLEASFEADNKLEAEKKQRLAAELGLQPRQVAVWFQNRRARCKTKQLELDFLALKADYDRVVAQRRHLQSEVSRLATELQQKNSKCKMVSCSQESTSSTNSNNGDLISEKTTLHVKMDSSIKDMDGFTSSSGNPNERTQDSTTRFQDMPNSTNIGAYEWESYDSGLWVFD